jgi:multidrug efflux pump subunit AcrB
MVVDVTVQQGLIFICQFQCVLALAMLFSHLLFTHIVPPLLGRWFGMKRQDVQAIAVSRAIEGTAKDAQIWGMYWLSYWILVATVAVASLWIYIQIFHGGTVPSFVETP